MLGTLGFASGRPEVLVVQEVVDAGSLEPVGEAVLVLELAAVVEAG